jgi:hypothetical protein
MPTLVPLNSCQNHSLKYEKEDQEDSKPDQEAGSLAEIAGQKLIYRENNQEERQQRRAESVN